MSNGAQCCALEICCDSPATLRRLPGVTSAFTGVDVNDCKRFLDEVQNEKLVFAPASFAAVLAIIPTFGPHTDEYRKWMAHEGLAFAPEAMRTVIADIVQIVRRHPTAAV